MILQEYQLTKSDRFTDDPFGVLPELKPLLAVRESETAYTLQQAYLLAAYFRSLLGLGNYSESDKKLINDLLHKFPSLNTLTQGSFLNFEMNDRAIKYMLNTKEALSLELSTNVLQLMTMWVSELADVQKQHRERADFDLFEKLNTLLNRLNAFNHVEDRVVFLSIIHKDLVSLLPQWLLASDKLHEPTEEKLEIKLDTTCTPTSEAVALPSSQQLASALTFLGQSLPKILYNILIRAEAFPRDMLIDQRPEYDLLYLNEGIDHLLGRSGNYCQLVRSTLTGLIKNFQRVDLSQQPTLLDLAFRFYYAYHTEEKGSIYPLLLSAFNGLANPVRYALNQQVVLFLTIVEKLGHKQLLTSMKANLPWVKELMEKSPPMACPKNNLEPLFGSEIQLTIPRGTRTLRILEVYREYSLVYFDVQCRSADIGVRFVYAGAFNSRLQENRTIFERERLKFKDNFKGSIEVILPGIYYFEFDNSYSWLTAKTVAYRAVVLSCMEIAMPGDVTYLKSVRSQLNLMKDKQLRLNRHQPFGVQLHSDASCEVFIDDNNYRLIITTTTKDNYQYELEGANKETAADKILERIRKYFSTRHYDKTIFKLGDVLIVSLKEFTSDLKQAVQRGSVLSIKEKMEQQKKEQEQRKLEEAERQPPVPTEVHSLDEIKGEIRPKHIAEVDSPVKVVGLAVSEEMTEVTEEEID